MLYEPCFLYGLEFDYWLVIEAMMITNADIHWVRHACHHYQESYARLQEQVTKEQMKRFEQAHRTLPIYTRTDSIIQKAWQIAGDIAEALYSPGIPPAKLEHVLVNHYGLPPLRKGRA